MKRFLFIKLALVFGIVGVCFWNLKQQQEATYLTKTVVTLKEKQKENRRKEHQLNSENERLAVEAAATSESLKKAKQKYANSSVNVDLKLEFINIATKLFEANLNFTPENYNDKQEEVSVYLSEELSKEYFGQKRITYQENNNISSKLELLDIYTGELRQNYVEGLIVAYHKSKIKGQDWVEGMNIFKVKYDSSQKKVIDIVNLGNGYFSKRKE